MSMRENVADGSVVALNAVVEKLPLSSDQKAKIKGFCEDNDSAGIEGVLEEAMVENKLPSVASVFLVDDDFTSEELTNGEWYVCFNDLELYKPRELTKAGQRLSALGLKPDNLVWTVFG